MGYILKKIISIPLQPLPLILIVMIAGIILWRRRGGSGLPLHLVSAGWTLLFLGSIPAISCMLIAPLEKHFSIRHASDLSGVRWIICLGGGANKTVDMPLSAQLAQISMARATEAIILARELPDRKLVFTGKNIAQKSRRLAIALGIDSSRILTVDSAKDTEMESKMVTGIVGTDSCALLTSASQLPRATGLFRKMSLHILPVPVAQFDVPPSEPLLRLVPAPEALSICSTAAHEYVGILWGLICGKI